MTSRFSFFLCLFIFGTLFSFAQEHWDYLPITFPDSRHGHLVAINDDLLHVVSDHGIFYKSTDGGITWKSFDSEVRKNFYEMSFFSNDIGYAVGAGGAILKTENAGETWNSLNSGTTSLLLSVDANASNSIWAVGDGVVLHSEDGGNSWIENRSLTDKHLNSVRFKSETEGYIAGNEGIFLYTVDGGETWKSSNLNTPNDLFGISFIDNQTLVLGGEFMSYSPDVFYIIGEQIFKTEDNQNWNVITTMNEPEGWTDIVFIDSETAFSINAYDALCECCYIVIDKSYDGGMYWDNSYTEKVYDTQGTCNIGYGRMAFPSPETGYVLVGDKILKTPYTSTVKVNNPKKPELFSIYPNPTQQGQFQIKMEILTFENTGIQIMDYLGKEIYQENINSKHHQIHLPNLSQGIYFVNLIQNGNILSTHKLINQ